MPMYVYKCKDCGQVFEKLVAVSSAHETQPCKHCSSKNTEKQIASLSSFSKKGGDSGGGCAPSSGFS